MLELYIYDGTFEGFLTCVFDYYDRKSYVIKMVSNEITTSGLLCEKHNVQSDQEKANRVWTGIQNKISIKGALWIYKAFLSEYEGRERILLSLIRKGFKGHKVTEDFADPEVLRMSQLVKMVDFEKRKIDDYLTFKSIKNAISIATIEPDCDVLPLKEMDLKNLQNLKWLVYDLCRNYGVYYDLKTTHYVQLVISQDINASLDSHLYFSYEELQNRDLWKNYFKGNTIPFQKTTRLHLKNIKKRIWISP